MAKIKAESEEPSSAPTQGPGLIFREEVLNRRVKVLFDVDTGKEDEPMAHRWYEGTVSAVQLEPANANAKAGGGGKRGGRRGANKKSAESTSAGASTKLKATHRVTFDDGDERWFDLVYWVGKGELQWVGGEAPTPESLPTMDPYADKTRNPTGTTTDAAEAAEAPNLKESAGAAAAPHGAEKPSPLVSPPNGKRNAPENSSTSSAEAPTPAKKAKSDPPQQESPPHTLVNGTKYYVV